MDQLFKLLRKSEITEAFSVSNKFLRKNDLFEELRQQFTEARTLSHWISQPLNEHVYEVNILPLCDRLRLMFFGNCHQDWTEFIFSDLGIYRYETVDFSLISRAFQSRQDIEDYLHLHRCRNQFNEHVDCQNLDEILHDMPSAYENTWLESRRARLLFKIARQYERYGILNSAQAVYRQCCTYPGARLRLIRILEKKGEFASAVSEAVRLRMDSIFGKGYDYTYLYPGLQKVVQAAGRVIRTPEDRGIIYLIDDRFSRPDIMNLLPRWWNVA